jgi:hypothetical protein
MDAFSELQRLRAAEAGTAMPLVSRRHVHLSEDPFVVAAYHLSGDPSAPVGFMYGTEPRGPRILIVPEPRNRDLRFATLLALAEDVRSYLQGFASVDARLVQSRFGEREDRVAVAAPQLLFANTPTADWFCGLLGRALRYLPVSGDRAVNPLIPRLGTDLSFFASRRAAAGQAAALELTQVGTVHWATGQTPIEDQNVLSLAVWLRRAAGAHLTDIGEELRVAEDLAAAGPVPTPAWDVGRLAPLVDDYNANVRAQRNTKSIEDHLREEVRAALAPTWSAIWEIRQALMRLPEAAHVASRWESDRRAWARHLQRIDAGNAFFRRIPDALQAARVLQSSESSAQRLEQEMSLDDVMVASRFVVNGEAIAGEVVTVDVDHQEMGPRRRVRRPLLVLDCDSLPEPPVGTRLSWWGRPQLEVAITKRDGMRATLMVVAGHGQGPVNPAALPAVGTRAMFGPWSPDQYFPSSLPAQVPWTHVMPDPPSATDQAEAAS